MRIPKDSESRTCFFLMLPWRVPSVRWRTSIQLRKCILILLSPNKSPMIPRWLGLSARRVHAFAVPFHDIPSKRQRYPKVSIRDPKARGFCSKMTFYNLSEAPVLLTPHVDVFLGEPQLSYHWVWLSDQSTATGASVWSATRSQSMIRTCGISMAAAPTNCGGRTFAASSLSTSPGNGIYEANKRGKP